MMGLFSITHLLSASLPNISIFTTTTSYVRGLGMETSSGASSSSGMCSLPCTPVEEERPGSSLSTASRSSRIPRLTRSASLRIKSSTVSYSSSVTNNTPETKTTTEGKSNADPRPTSRAEVKGITRSASFVTSRGMYGRASPPSTTHTPTSSHHRHSSSTPRVYGPSLTPETPRRVHHASAYTRRTTSLTERKTHTNVESESKNSINTTAICNGPSQRGETQGRLATEPRATPSTPTPKTSSTPSEGSEPELSRLMDNLTTVTSESGAVRVPVVSPAGGSVAETTADSVELTRSLADSGHYEDLTSPCLSSRDPFEASRGSLRGPRIDEDEDEVDPWTVVEETEARLREEYERREDQLKRNHMDEYHELKEKHNDRVESLLSKLSDANLKYFELRPMYDRSQERVRELERDVTRLKDELSEAELRHQKMYLQMFLKGQQSAKLQADDQDGEDGSQSSLSSVGPMVDLLKQLSRTEDELEKIKGAVPFLPSSLSSPVIRGLTDTSSLGAPNAALLDGKQAISLYFQGRRQALYHREVACRNNNNNGSSITKNGELDPEVTLQFLKSAIYYFLTDKDNSRGHLRAIESILGYTDSERYNIDKVVK
nr:uncharacterized protein LOC128693165 [Cherax quadricarinatus]